jgi:hypothetical protein
MFPKKMRRSMHLARAWGAFDKRLAEWLIIDYKYHTDELMDKYRVRKWW